MPKKGQPEKKPDLGNELINFGIYDGCRFDAIPLRYLNHLLHVTWIDRETQIKISKYMNNDTRQKILAEEIAFYGPYDDKDDNPCD